MKIKNFDKINGFTYKGYCIVNPIHNADETKYMADVLDLNTPQKTKWELSILTPAHKFTFNQNEFFVMLRDENHYSSTKYARKIQMSNVSNFRILFEELVDELLKLRLTSVPIYNSHSINTAVTAVTQKINSGGASSGILNAITANSNTIAWAPSTSTNLPNEMLVAIKELQDQIDKLKQQQNEI